MRPRLLRTLVLTGALSSFALFPGSAAAQGDESPSSNAQPNATAAPLKLSLTGTQKSWTKVCGKDKQTDKSVCYTTRDFSAEVGKPPLVAFAVYAMAGSDTAVVRVLLPIGLSLPPGISLAIDGGAPVKGIYDICFAKGCFAEVKVTTATLGAMKRGTTLAIEVRNQASLPVIFALPLEGFGKASDGTPIDPKVLQEEAKKLQADQKAAAERQQMKSGNLPSRQP